MNEQLIQKVFGFAADLMTTGMAAPEIQQNLVNRLHLTPESAAQVASTLFRLCKIPPAHLELYLETFREKYGLEIGGPSAIFRSNGLLPVYSVLANVDNCIFNNSTVWSGPIQEGRHFVYQENKPPGRQYVCEASELQIFPDKIYDAVLSCHNIEHIANPIKALNEWRRVLKPDGYLLLVAPHKEGSFDHRRSPTSLKHLLDDFQHDTGEDDLTHFEEIMALHDLTRDPSAGNHTQFRQRSQENFRHRCLHHHVFTTANALNMVNHLNMKIILCDTIAPHYIFILSQKPDEGTNPDNSRFLDNQADFRKNSPFQSDRLHP